jgi:hypothetical protein
MDDIKQEIEIVIKAIEKAQFKGCYSLQESYLIFKSIISLKTKLEKEMVVDK